MATSRICHRDSHAQLEQCSESAASWKALCIDIFW